MGIFENCCCIFDLRVGTALSGVYSAVTSCIPFVLALLSFISLYVYPDIYISEWGEYVFEIIKMCLMGVIGMWGLHILSCMLLLVAACKNDRCKLVPYMVFTALIVIAHLAGTSAILYWLLAIEIPYVATGPFVGLTLSLINGLLNLYCLLVVISHYQELSYFHNNKKKIKDYDYKPTEPKLLAEKTTTKAEENDYGYRTI